MGKAFRRLVFLIAVFSAAGFSPGLSAEEKKAEDTVITIENARATNYEKDKDTGNDCILLSGDVRVSVVRGSTKNEIRADSIKYDRVTEMMYAEGGVSLRQTTESSGGESVTATSLMFNVATLEGVFDDGRVVQTKSDALNLPAGSTLIVASDIFGRSESNTIAFRDGSLTFCDDEDPHWHIDASRIWLLPGGEFAFVNALVYVGAVPVMYFPAFYYPKDELIFNPVFGYTPREGYSIQTTAYLFGRKPLDTSDSSSSDSSDDDGAEKAKALFNFIRPSVLKEQRVEGLMLHNLDADYKGDTTNYLKIMGDWYSNLGVMVGLDGVLKPKKYVDSLELNARLGFTRTVFKSGAAYSPHSPSGETYTDSSNFLGVEMPFRYGAKAAFSMSKPFSLSLSLPIYSDPYFDDDFSERSETMDWISYLLQSNVDDDDDTINETTSFQWTLSSSYSVPLPAVIKPYVSTLSLSLNSSVVFSSMTNTAITGDSADTDGWRTYTPQRKFYYPSQISPATITGTIAGTIFEWRSSGTKSAAAQSVQFASPLIAPEDLAEEKDGKSAESPAAGEDGGGRRDGADEEDGAAAAAAGGVPGAEGGSASGGENPGGNTADGPAGPQKDGASPETKNAEETEYGIPLSEGLPALVFSPDAVTEIPGIEYALKYSVKPSLTSQVAYASSALEKPEDFEWKNSRSYMYTIKIPVTLDSAFNYAGNFFSMDNSLLFDPVFQDHPYISTDTEKGGYTESAAAALRKADYTAEKRDLTNTNTVAFKPFYYVRGFQDSGVTWRSTIKVVRTNFIGDADNPEWEYLTVDWADEESVTVNALDFTLATNQLDRKFTQSLTLTTTLPPQPDQYYGTLKLGFPYTTFTVEAGIKRNSADDDTWVRQPLKQNLTFSIFNDSLKLSESYNYDLEEEHHDSFKAALSWQGLQAAYTMSYTTGYDFDEDSGWVARADKEFLPYSLSLAYAPATKTLHTWKNRISLGVGLSTSVVADLLRPTDSYFLFSPSVSLKINDFLTFTFSSTSRNAVIYRYFQKLAGNEGLVPGETNVFKDLLNSFRFDDDDLRKNSGFKLKSLNFEVTHDLHDWDFTASFKLEPRLITESSKSYYDFSPYMTISVLWRPMPSMKTEIVDDYGTWELN